MRPWKLLCCAAALAGMTAFVARPAHADEWNKLTYFTFSAPVQIPGATLPAGTYAFKLADMYGNRHIVQVFNKDQTHLYNTILAIPNDRGQGNEAQKPIVLFQETPAGQPAAVKAWFYPGMRIGDEFVYPKEQATRIAKANHEPVLASESAMNDNDTMKSAKLGHVDENGNMTEDQNAGAPSQNAQANTNPPAASSNAQPTGTTATGTSAERNLATGTSADRNPSGQANAAPPANRRANRARSNNAVGTSGQAPSNGNNNRPARLPQTASPFGLIALLSGLSLFGAFGVNRLRVRLSQNR